MCGQVGGGGGRGYGGLVVGVGVCGGQGVGDSLGERGSLDRLEGLIWDRKCSNLPSVLKY